MQLFKQTYDGDSICDIERDVAEALDERFNPLVKAIPADEYGIQEGEFIVTIEWTRQFIRTNWE